MQSLKVNFDSNLPTVVNESDSDSAPDIPIWRMNPLLKKKKLGESEKEEIRQELVAAISKWKTGSSLNRVYVVSRAILSF